MINKKYTSLLFLIQSTLLFLLFHFSNCNLWDNIYSNLQNPFVNIPDEFKLELYNSNIKNNNTKSAELWVSVSSNKIKITFYDSLKFTNSLNYLFQTFITDFKKLNESNFIQEDKNPVLKNKVLLNLVLDLNERNTSLIIYNNMLCNTQNLTLLNNIKVKFLLVSFDLFTFLNEDSNSNFFDYIVADNPIKLNLRKNSRKEYQNENILKTLGFLKDYNLYGNKNSMGATIENKSSIVFRVNKETTKLDEVNFKYEQREVYHFSTNVIIYDKVTKKVFQNKNKNCEALSSLNSSKGIFDIILEQIINKYS